MRMETFTRKSLGWKAHTVVKVAARAAEGERAVYVKRRGHRSLRCGVCGLEARRVAPTRRAERRWHDRAMRDHTVGLVYAPRGRPADFLSNAPVSVVPPWGGRPHGLQRWNHGNAVTLSCSRRGCRHRQTT